MWMTICRLTVHDYLFYASSEMGRLYETQKYLHNYGLTYALGLAKAPFANHTQVPRYHEDLTPLNEQGLYVTPAAPLHCVFGFHTFKMAETSYYSFTPQISTNQAIFGRAKEIAPESIFEFCVLSTQQVVLPSWIRLGKWMSKAQVAIVASKQVQKKQGRFFVRGALNPLDMVAIPESCNVIAMAPASLLTNACYTGSYYAIAPDGSQKEEPYCVPADMLYLAKRCNQSA